MSIYGVGASSIARTPVQVPVRDGGRAPGQRPAAPPAATPGAARSIAPKTSTNPGQQSVPVIVINIGRSGSGRTFSGSFSIKTASYLDQYVVEKSTQG